MAKRLATSDLNHDNWDREDEPEEAGSFAKANEETLKKRVIKVAKRRNAISSMLNEDGKPAAFGGFSGFGKTPSTSSDSTFEFLSNIKNKTETPKTNGTSEEAESSDKKLDEYYSKLKGLNESVTEWIKKHVSSNPFINLQPIFKDYDKYIGELDKMKNEVASKPSNTVFTTGTTAAQFTFNTSSTNSVPKFSFGTYPSQTTNATSNPSFLFGASTASFNSESSTVTTSFSSSKPIFSFGSTSSSDSGKFSFTSQVVKPADEPKTEEQDEDEPPKVEFKAIVEEGHVYTTRCKVFVKKEGKFADHGVGTLYLKPVPDSEKIQLIVRAETNLGRLLCNFILSESIPMQRMGKKDVMLVCIPNPETQPPPVPILLRVKSSEDADDLLSNLQKHKK